MAAVNGHPDVKSRVSESRASGVTIRVDRDTADTTPDPSASETAPPAGRSPCSVRIKIRVWGTCPAGSSLRGRDIIRIGFSYGPVTRSESVNPAAGRMIVGVGQRRGYNHDRATVSVRLHHKGATTANASGVKVGSELATDGI